MLRGYTTKDEHCMIGSAGERLMSFLAEFWKFLRVRKRFWLLPLLVMMMIFGALLVLAEGSAVAPFIYTLF